MKALLAGILVLCAAWPLQTGAVQHHGGSRFVAIDIFLESAEPVAAWQFEFGNPEGPMKIVGVESGESPAFGDAPYYDRETVRRGAADRIIVADFSLAEKSRLPSGRFRIATLHLMLDDVDVPSFDLDLVTAVTQDGRPVDAMLSFESGERQER